MPTSRATWNSRARSIDKPDRMIFDLDPGEGVKWAAMQEAATLTRVLLAERYGLLRRYRVLEQGDAGLSFYHLS